MDAAAASFNLPQLGTLAFEGPDTREFLQGQLSCDAKMPVGQWVWGGYLTPQGRVLATFLALALADDHVALVLDKSLIPALLEKFKMYLLRAKTKPVEDNLPWAAKLSDPSSPAQGEWVQDGDKLALGMGQGMTLLWGERASSNVIAVNDWFAQCAQRGYPWLDDSLQGELTPHMVSLDLVGGVDFDKGCYIGQEVVIRTHHRGKVKKRLFVIKGDGKVPAPRTDVKSAIHRGQTAGNVLYASAQGGGFVGVASIRKDAVAGDLELEESGVFTASAPPYGLIDPKFESE